MIPSEPEMEDGLKDSHMILFKIDGGMDRIGKGLGVGAGRTDRNFRMGRLEVDNARQKDPLHPFLKKVEDMAMAYLDGKTGLRNNILHSFPDQLLIRCIGEDGAITQLRKEGFPEWHHLVEEKNSWDSDLRSIGRKIFFPFIRGKEHPLPLLEEVGEVGPLGPLDDIILLATTPVEEGLLAFHAHLSDEAEIGTTFAFEGGLFITALAEVEPFKARTLPGPLLHRQNGDTNGSGHIAIFRGDDLFFANVFKGGNDSFIESRSSLEEDPVSDAAVSDHPVQIVLNNVVTDPSNEVILGGAPLLVMDEGRFDEDRAPLPHPHRFPGREGKVSKLLFDRDVQFFRLLF